MQKGHANGAKCFSDRVREEGDTPTDRKGYDLVRSLERKILM